MLYPENQMLPFTHEEFEVYWTVREGAESSPILSL